MTKHWPGFGSDQPTVESEATGSGSENGVSPDDAVGLPDGSVEERVATEGEVSAAADNGAATPAGWADAEVGAAAEAGDDGSVFLAELVRTLQTTAGLERVRIAEETEQRRQAHIDQIRSRQASEADRMRELAGDDTKAIDAWADGETKRIQLERERRATKRNEDLETSLAEHTSKIDREVERVETAIAAYRADVDAFFDGLDRQTNLVLMAKQATRRPVFPTLDAVAESVADSSADADESEPAAVGVMDPQAAPEPVESWLVPPETSPEPALAAAFADVEQGGQPRSSGSLFQSTPVERPMSRPRRDANDGEGSNREG
jgi:hypothetical protein